MLPRRGLFKHPLRADIFPDTCYVFEINKINKRRKSGGVYLNRAELRDILQQGYQVALKIAALQALEGRYEAQELAAMVISKKL
ncbi:hypothetical protein H6G93_21505 [Nostoc sp. FACHB-973]|nr:hypothetical protein [Nostoc sp. FACHB-973]